MHAWVYVHVAMIVGAQMAREAARKKTPARRGAYGVGVVAQEQQRLLGDQLVEVSALDQWVTEADVVRSQVCQPTVATVRQAQQAGNAGTAPSAIIKKMCGFELNLVK